MTMPQTTTAEVPKLYTLAEVAEMTGLTLRQLRARRHTYRHIRPSGSRQTYMTAPMVAEMVAAWTAEPRGEVAEREQHLAVVQSRVGRRRRRAAA